MTKTLDEGGDEGDDVGLEEHAETVGQAFEGTERALAGGDCAVGGGVTETRNNVVRLEKKRERRGRKRDDDILR